MSALKAFIKNVVHRFGVDIIRYPPTVIEMERVIARPFNLLEFIIEHYLSRGDRFFFVQVGANNGVRWDPLHDLICKHHLTGLLVEPLPDIFDELIRNYAKESQLLFEASAIAQYDGSHPIFRVSPGAPVGDWAQGIASFSRSHLVNHLKPEGLKNFERYIQEIRIPTISVESLLKKHDVSSVTLLQIDTEGYDLEVLKFFLSSKVRPFIINFERANLSPKDQQESRRLLIKYGYRFLDVGIDTLAMCASITKPSEPDDAGYG